MHASQNDVFSKQISVQRKEASLSEKKSDFALLNRTNRLLLAHLDNLLASRTFAKSEYLKRFIKFLVAKVIQSQEHQIKEYSLGVDVFGRDQTFDPKLDTIVRVQAYRLRSKLKEYYRTEGRNEQLRIDIPKGSYIPMISDITNKHVTNKEIVCKSFPTCRIAVLPFLNLSEEAKTDHTLTDAIAETLIDDLTLAGTLEVVAPIHSSGPKHRQRDIQVLDKQFNLDALLEGSIQKVKALMRVKARLIAVSNGCATWSTTFDIKYRSRLAVQEQISKTIVPSILALLSSDTYDQSNVRGAAS